MVGFEYPKNIEFMNNIIKNMHSPYFRSMNDINLENLRDFLIPLFREYEMKKINYSFFTNFGNALETYLHVKFGNDFPDTLYPVFDKSDFRSIGIEVIEYMNISNSEFFIFPKDIPYFIEFLKTPIRQENEAHQKIKEYVSQFELDKRLVEARFKGYLD